MSQATQDVREDGIIESVSGPVVQAVDLDARMNDVVYVGDEGLMGVEVDGLYARTTHALDDAVLSDVLCCLTHVLFVH